MTKRKMLAALLAGLIALSLAGCGADKTENTGSDPASTESGITATVTDSTAEPTVESSLPAGTESTTESTTEKEKESSTAPADIGKTEAAKPADTESPKQTEPPKVTETPKQTESPKVTEPPETKPTEPPTKPTEPQPTEPQPTEPPATEQPKGFTEADHTRIVSEVKTYAESYTAKGFTFEWAEELEFGWDVGWMGTPRISRDGVDGVISTLKHHVDLIYKTGTDPANGVTANSVRYKVVQLEIDGGIAYAVIYG